MKQGHPSRRTFFEAALTTSALGLLQAQESVPNVLVILADDLGFGDLSSFGAKDLHTPHIDALVESGVKFSNFYANSPVCSPTRAAVLAGRYSDLIVVPGLVRTHPEDNWGYLSRETRLLPQMIKPAGHHSA